MKEKIACILIFLIISYSSLYQYFHLTGLGYLIAIASLCLLFELSRKSKTKYYINNNTGLCMWAILSIYHSLNCAYHGTFDLYMDMRFYLAAIEEICLLCFIPYVYNLNRKMLYITLLFATFTFLAIAYEICDTVENGRLQLEGFIVSTQLGQFAGLTCVLISLCILFFKKSFLLYFLYILPLTIIILTQSRNAFLPVIFAGLILLVDKIVNFRSFYVIVFSLILIWGYDYFQSTELFARYSDSGASDFWITDTIWDKIFGDRAIYYVLGISDFVEHPINGIGLYNFLDTHQIGWPLHGELITHISEGGLIGLILYVLFVCYYIKNLFKNYTFKNVDKNVMILVLLPLLILGFTTREYPFNFFYIFYGLITGYIYEQQLKEDIVPGTI